MSSPGKTPVGILGATGLVGQRFLTLLDRHPWFEPVWLAASERSQGLSYAEATRWRLATPMPERFAALPVHAAATDRCPVQVVFAALETAAAREIEPRFVAAGHRVISNSSALRMNPEVPLLVPEVNADHLRLLDPAAQGYAVANPNCSTAGLVLALAPLERAFGIETVFVATLQAVSGAGYPGVAALDILGNVIPYIGGEEEKMESESRKILGSWGAGGIAPAALAISAHCHRVAVEDGHTESVSVKLKRPASAAEAAAVLRDFTAPAQVRALPSAPAHPVIVLDAPDRPQPRLDANAGAGMSATVGRLRPCPVLDLKFTLLSHNTIRGAAGAAVLNAELLRAEGRL